MQCPYYIHKALAALFGLPAERIRVVQMETGGGFGGKEEYPSMIAGHAALLAWKSGQPVKMIYGRAEDMAATTKRHPSRTSHRTGGDERRPARRHGHRLRDRWWRVLHAVAGRAVARHNPRGRAICLSERALRGRAVATSAPPHGAFRGFGAPQSIFALERHMDKVAAAVGLSPEEFRRRNFIRPGDTLAVGQTIREPVDMSGLLDRALADGGLHAKREQFARDNATARRSERASASRRSCTAPASPAPARST